MSFRWLAGLTLAGALVASAAAQTGSPPPFPAGLSLLQKTLIRHAGMRSAHIKVDAKLPDGWSEQSELWIERPDKLNYATRMIPPQGQPLESHVAAWGGKVTVWASQPNPENPKLTNVYFRTEQPPDVVSLDAVARFGVTQFVLRLFSGEPQRLIGADRVLKAIPGDNLAIVSKDAKQSDELEVDPQTGLLKSVKARFDGQVVASGEVTYLSVNEPLDAKSFDWKLPQGARELPAPK